MPHHISLTPRKFRSDPTCALLGQESPTNPLNVIVLRPAVQKFITMVPFQHLSVRPSICSNHMAPAHPSARYVPHTCPNSKVISQPINLPSQYHSTSLTDEQISVITEASLDDVRDDLLRIGDCSIPDQIGQDIND
jgi:hypothetical protein